MSVIEEIAAERKRQIEAEGFSAEHDDKHCNGELAVAASCYARSGAGWDDSLPAHGFVGIWVARGWPWHPRWWKPSSPRRDLIRAAALIVGAIERLDRISARAPAVEGS